MYTTTRVGPLLLSANGSLTLTSQVYEKVVLSAFHSMLVVGFSWTWFEVKKDLGNMGDELFQGITWT